MSATLKPSTLKTGIDCNGTPQLVVTVQHEGESLKDFDERHLADVTAAVAACGGSSTMGLSNYTTPVKCDQATNDVYTQQGESQTWANFLTAHYDAVRSKVQECA
tara:strand:+ start:15247 stop:15561 length:315 start_codon:yes stop_codon:yes gene_type:complete